ncbi:MAG: excinuclease ABC subunit UvrC [Acidobacteria bacterium]|nr:excinuclease ABC subunit UvrC [Acidobacteriota bacterium]
MFPESLLKSVEELPAKPGVYLFSDKKRKLLYVGKARSLKSRVRSYFQEAWRGPRIQKMISRIYHLEVIVTQTEGEALLLENSLIKNQKPQYNVQLRDDKTYPYIKVTDEAFPRVKFTRRTEAKDGRYFGPFPSAKAARQAIRLMHHHFKIRNCDLDLGKKEYQPCLQWHMKRCDAPCAFKVDAPTYQQGVQRAKLFLSGQTHELMESLSGEMRKAAQELAFEKAAYLRDLLGLVSSVQRRQDIANLPLRKTDVVGYAHNQWQVSVAILVIREGNLVRTQQFQMDWEEDLHQDVATYLSHYYLNHEDPPAEIVVREGNAFGLLDQAYLQLDRTLAIISPKQGVKERLLIMAEETARTQLDLHLHEVGADPALSQLADTLGLDELPRTIECFDISNTMGTYSVASMVRFQDGKPDKKNYRKFKIKTVEGPDDFASMAEVVTRRYRRLLDEGKSLPDLIMVDGGLGQLHSAHLALSQLGLADHPLISLAKREEWVYTTADNDPIILPHREPALRLLQHLRDEAHRFGITFHRQRRSKAMLQSELGEIPGLGKVRQQRLLHHFGSVARVKGASLDQLCKVLGKKTGASLFAYFRGEPAKTGPIQANEP